MENTKLNIISALERVFEKAKNSKLEINSFKSVEKELSVLNEYFHTNDMESILITLVMNVENFENARVKKMASYVGLNHLNFLPFATNLMALHQRNIITPSYGENYELSEDYALEPKLITYLSKNERIPSEILQVSETENNFHEFINEIDGLNEKKAKKS
jgi:hypothetical protein